MNRATLGRRKCSIISYVVNSYMHVISCFHSKLYCQEIQVDYQICYKIFKKKSFKRCKFDPEERYSGCPISLLNCFKSFVMSFLLYRCCFYPENFMFFKMCNCIVNILKYSCHDSQHGKGFIRTVLTNIFFICLSTSPNHLLKVDVEEVTGIHYCRRYTLEQVSAVNTGNY